MGLWCSALVTHYQPTHAYARIKGITMFFKKEYKVIARRQIGMDPFTYEPIYTNDYRAVMVPMWNRIVMTVIAMAIIIVGIIGATIVLSSNDTAATSNVLPTITTMVEETTTTMVEESTTTVAEVTAAMVEETTTTVAPVTAEYVCDTYTNSSEYTATMFPMEDGSMVEIPWETMVDNHVVMQWNLPMDSKYDDFMGDIALFNQYTHMGVQVVDSSYVPTETDWVVPVVERDLPELHVAEMQINVAGSSTFLGVSLHIQDATLAVDPSVQDDWANHTHIILHEMGHLMGLDHTHDAEGEQVQSIMSYESDYSYGKYLPGDIAGLQQVICN
jgi:hypothetical protein